MNEAQRRVLRNQHGTILKNLILDTDILGYLLQNNVLSEQMMQNIQSKPSQHEKICELLLVLPKRGPKAFPVFLEAIKKASSFLFDKLQTEYEKEQKKICLETSQTDLDGVSSDKPEKGHEDLTSASTVAVIPRNLEKVFEKSFISIRTGPKDLSERRHSMSIASTNHAMTSNIIQHNLNTLYTKLKAKLLSREEKEHSFSSPEPASFKMVDKLVDDMFQALDEYEMTFSQCQALLGGRDRNYPLMSHIINIQKSKRELEQDLKSKEQQKNKYADHISKLENRCRNQTTEINHLNEEIKKLKEEVEKLQAINCEREEKQKIIDELRKMVMDADTTKKSKLRSSYLALHYDSNSTEIKQLRAEVRSVRLDNENLKTENLMLKRSENLKKLAKIREDQSQANLKVESEEKDSLCFRGRQRPAFSVPPPPVPLRGPQKRADSERQPLLQHQMLDKSGMRLSAAADSVTADSEEKAKLVKDKSKERDFEDLDFKFSNHQNGSLGQKRTQSKDRTNKRVTFLSDTAKQSEVVKVPSAVDKHEKETVGAQAAMVNGQPVTNGNGKGNGNSKPDKSASNFTRKKQSHLKTKSSSKRSASLNNLSTSKDIMKISSQLIQKSKNLRQPTSH